MADGGGRYDTEGEGKRNIQKTVDSGGAGFSLDVTLSTYQSIQDRKSVG